MRAVTCRQSPARVVNFGRIAECRTAAESKICKVKHIVTVEVINGHRWSPSVSTDGVASEVTTLRPRALREVTP